MPEIDEASMASLRAFFGDCPRVVVFLTNASFSELLLALLKEFYTDFF
jgi:hypothetical protein